MQIQLENLESSVRDRCKKEFTGEASRAGVARGPPYSCSGHMGSTDILVLNRPHDGDDGSHQ